MIILALRTDKPESELTLLNDRTVLNEIRWQAHRQLAETIHTKIDELLETADHTKQDISGIVCFKGPGSFTGLRIGLTVANAIAAMYEASIVCEGSDDWRDKGTERLLDGENDILAIPEYGAPPTTTVPKK